MQLPLSEVREILGIAFAGESAPSVVARGWSIDSRTAQPGDVFFAIPGPLHDGHAFVNAAFARGAVAAVVSAPVDSPGGPLLQVPNTVAALQRLARELRRRWGRPLVAVTGSAGKTTTKDVIAALLATRFRVGKTEGNFNNHIGLPLSLLRLPAEAGVAVIEIGMNHAGEIRDLSAIAEPDIGVVTNAGYAHIENFDSPAGVALAKRELIEALPPSGTAVLNADDARVLAFREVHPGRTVTYGFSAHADVRGENLKLEPGRVSFTVRGVGFHGPLAGRHGAMNILAGLAVSGLFDIELEELVDSVAAIAPGEMRGARSVWRGITVLNDCYNSNPDAVRFMLDQLMDEPARRRIAVLGEMRELGHWAEALHRDVGKYVAEVGIDVLVGIRGAGRFLVDAAMNAGVNIHAAYFFEEPEQAGEFLREFVQPGDAILFKGSRGVHVERALAVMES